MKPEKNDVRHTDAVSCFYCHQIAYVKAAHRSNEIVLAKQDASLKPQLFGSLDNPDESDKHAMVRSPIYDKYACSGCHSHKRNKNGVLIFRAMKEGEDSTGCIRCHMPEESGGPEKMNKKARSHHHGHAFAGIHDAVMRTKGLDIAVQAEKGDKTLTLTLHNKMDHPLIIQPAREKYIETVVVRNGKTLWRNFKEKPSEDIQAYFAIEYLDDKGRMLAVPYTAVKRGFVNNIDANETKTLRYSLPEALQKGDRIVATEYVVFAKRNCVDTLHLDPKWSEPVEMKKVEKVIK
jgi:hypothetical protein